jgi:hypothetical protein
MGGVGSGGSGRKLSGVQVTEIRTLYAAGSLATALAVAYGVSNGAISKVVRGITYADAGGPISSKMTGSGMARRSWRNRSTNWTPEHIALIGAIPNAALAEILGVTPQAVAQARYRRAQARGGNR